MNRLTLLNPNKKERAEENSPFQPFQNFYWWVFNNFFRPHETFFLSKWKEYLELASSAFCFPSPFHLLNFNYHLTATTWFLLSSAFDYYSLLYCSSISKTQISHNHLVLPSAAFTGKYTKTIGMRRVRGLLEPCLPDCHLEFTLPPATRCQCYKIYVCVAHQHIMALPNNAELSNNLSRLEISASTQKLPRIGLQENFLSCAEEVVLCLPIF